ncbi:MAG: hypothetical protein RMK29_08980 [Myxococcales bacterium]|nr:hypothetical protein [Myxococcales bacterium]
MSRWVLLRRVAGLAVLLGALSQTGCRWMEAANRMDQGAEAPPGAWLWVDDSFEREMLNSADLGWEWTDGGCTLEIVTQDGGIPLDNDGTILPDGGVPNEQVKVKEDRWLRVENRSDGGCTTSVRSREAIPAGGMVRTAVVRFDHTFANNNLCMFSAHLNGQLFYHGRARSHGGGGLNNASRVVSVVNLPQGVDGGLALEFAFGAERSVDGGCAWRLSNVRVMGIRGGGLWP